MKRSFLVALAMAVPLGLFVAALEANSWRPKVIGSMRGAASEFTLSRDGKWLVVQSSPGEGRTLWNLGARRRVRELPWSRRYVFSPDSRTLAVVDESKSAIQLPTHLDFYFNPARGFLICQAEKRCGLRARQNV